MIEDLKNLALRTFKTINASGVARIDFLVDEKNMKIYVNEINTIPGSLAFYLFEKVFLKNFESIDSIGFCIWLTS